jgi:hypothetical protein
MKPVINIDELEYTDWGERSFQQRYAEIMSYVGTSMKKELEHVARADEPVDYLDGEA